LEKEQGRYPKTRVASPLFEGEAHVSCHSGDVLLWSQDEDALLAVGLVLVVVVFSCCQLDTATLASETLRMPSTSTSVDECCSDALQADRAGGSERLAREFLLTRSEGIASSGQSMLESFGFRSKNADFGAGRVVTSNIEFHGWHCAASARLLFKTEAQLPLYGDNVLNNLIEVLSLIKVDGHEAVLRGNLESSASFDVRVNIFHFFEGRSLSVDFWNSTGLQSINHLAEKDAILQGSLKVAGVRETLPSRLLNKIDRFFRSWIGRVAHCFSMEMNRVYRKVQKLI